MATVVKHALADRLVTCRQIGWPLAEGWLAVTCGADVLFLLKSCMRNAEFGQSSRHDNGHLTMNYARSAERKGTLDAQDVLDILETKPWSAYAATPSGALTTAGELSDR